jgi:hypothetical protein
MVSRDEEKGLTVARGDVRARFQGRTLTADEVTFEASTRLIRARGNVRIINPDRTAQFAQEIVLDQSLSVGAAAGFAVRSEGPIKMAAASAVRRSETVNELNQAIYTPCEVCAKNGDPKTPTWSIQAEQIVQDRSRQVVSYRNAVIRVRGAPVLYIPVFWHPDPQAERRSGFLTPKLQTSGRRGLSYEQPYVHVFNPSADLTLSPQINSKVAPFLNAHYRQRFRTGAIDVRGGFTYDRDFDGEGDAFGDPTARSYILASGAFALTPEWKWGFSAERTSDTLLFEKYDIGDVYVARGPFVPDDRRLISQVYATRQTAKSWFSAGAFTIQGLRPEDDDRTFPTVGPFVEGRFEPIADLVGGRLRIRTTGVVLTRDTAPGGPAGVPGLDSRRATFEADWRRTSTTVGGLRVALFGKGLADGFDHFGRYAGGNQQDVRRQDNALGNGAELLVGELLGDAFDMGPVQADGTDLARDQGFDSHVALDDFSGVVGVVLQPGIGQHLRGAKLLRRGADLAEGNLLALQISHRLDVALGHHDELREIVRTVPADHGLGIGELGEDHVFGRPGQNEIDLLGAHCLDSRGAVVDRRELDVVAGGLLELLDEAAIFALQLLHAFDVGDGEADGFGGRCRRQKASCECKAGKPFLNCHECRSSYDDAQFATFHDTVMKSRHVSVEGWSS